MCTQAYFCLAPALFSTLLLCCPESKVCKEDQIDLKLTRGCFLNNDGSVLSGADDEWCASQLDELKYITIWRPKVAQRITPAILQAAQNINTVDNLNGILEYLHMTVAVIDIDHDSELGNELCVSAISFCLQLLWWYKSLEDFWEDEVLQKVFDVLATLMSISDPYCALVRSAITEWSQQMSKTPCLAC